jgi:hypothetical protein
MLAVIMNQAKSIRETLHCPGTLPRRAFLRNGVAAGAGLSLAGLLRAEALAGSGSLAGSSDKHST